MTTLVKMHMYMYLREWAESVYDYRAGVPSYASRLVGLGL